MTSVVAPAAGLFVLTMIAVSIDTFAQSDDSRNANANRLFVDAILQIQDAEDNYDIDLARQAKRNIEKIIYDYPDSNIAVAIVSDNLDVADDIKKIQSILTRLSNRCRKKILINPVLRQ
jgi:hypothetical protein